MNANTIYVDAISIAGHRTLHRAMEASSLYKTILVRPNQSVRELSNLGWLLRNWKQVHDVHVNHMRWIRLLDSGDPLTSVYGPTEDIVKLGVRMTDGSVFACRFADKTVLHEWLDRPVLRGRPIFWEHHCMVIGSADYTEHGAVMNERIQREIERKREREAA